MPKKRGRLRLSGCEAGEGDPQRRGEAEILPKLRIVACLNRET